MKFEREQIGWTQKKKKNLSTIWCVNALHSSTTILFGRQHNGSHKILNKHWTTKIAGIYWENRATFGICYSYKGQTRAHTHTGTGDSGWSRSCFCHPKNCRRNWQCVCVGWTRERARKYFLLLPLCFPRLLPNNNSNNVSAVCVCVWREHCSVPLHSILYNNNIVNVFDSKLNFYRKHICCNIISGWQEPMLVPTWEMCTYAKHAKTPTRNTNGINIFDIGARARAHSLTLSAYWPRWMKWEAIITATTDDDDIQYIFNGKYKSVRTWLCLAFGISVQFNVNVAATQM